MNWQQLIVKDKILPSSVLVNDDNERSEFERDHNKIIFSSFFRNLQNKTQLFPIPHSAFVHSRLTHSLEVASVGKSIGNLVAKKIINNRLATDLPPNFARDVTDIVGAACLLHDIGNPPFGHAGEDAISNFFRNNAQSLNYAIDDELITQLANFDGNAQTLRIIHNAYNLNLTIATVASVIKYPTSYDPHSIYKGKHSVFNSEMNLFQYVATACGLTKLSNAGYCRHPLAFLVEAADDICYRLLDIEDAHKIGLIEHNAAMRFMLQIIDSRNKDLTSVTQSIKDLPQDDQFAKLRSYAINVLIGEAVDQFIYNYTEIMSGEYNKLLINGKLSGLIDLLIHRGLDISGTLVSISDQVRQFAYSFKPVLEIELAGYEILSYLLEQYTKAMLNRNNDNDRKAMRLLKLLPECYRLTSNDHNQNILQITDYISSMADKYALDLYKKLRGIELPEVH